jgi:hypothetical protein
MSLPVVRGSARSADPEAFVQAAARSHRRVFMAVEMGLAEDEPANSHSKNDATSDAVM